MVNQEITGSTKKHYLLTVSSSNFKDAERKRLLIKPQDESRENEVLCATIGSRFPVLNALCRVISSQIRGIKIIR